MKLSERILGHINCGTDDGRAIAAAVEELEQKLAAAERERDDRRESLAQELREGLKVRGLWAPKAGDPASDTISAVFMALDELRQDKARLDWLAGRFGLAVADEESCDLIMEAWFPTTGETWTQFDLRAAIDAARSSEGSSE